MSALPIQLNEYPRRMAVIDVGSNSVKMVCYSADRTGIYRPYHRESSRVRLDEYGDGIIREHLIVKLIDVLLMFRNIIQYEGVGKVLAVATSAVRSAENRESVILRVSEATGFHLNVLSGDGEALYSYAGAANNLHMPTCMFFDLGGGSMELVSSRNHTIIKALSVPLGALVLTRKFTGEGDFDDVSTRKMRRHVQDTLPSLESMGMLGNDAILVGVGGTLRTIAKYIQEQTEYPLKKMHNYTMDAQAINAAVDDILSKDTRDLANMYEVGRGRADIIKAGVVTISEVLRKYDFDGIRVCSTGLREGVLAIAARYTSFDSAGISPYHVRELVRAPSGTPRMPPPVSAMIQSFKSSKLLFDEEPLVLQSAAVNLERLRAFRDADDFLYKLMDIPSVLSHRQQLLASLCLTYSKKPKRTKLLMKRYDTIITGKDEKMIKRLSPILELCDLLIISRANSHAQFRDGVASITIRRNKSKLPHLMLEAACRDIGDALNIDVTTKFI